MADKEPLVSVIVPVRDGESSIADTLASSAGQTYRNVEIIVVDDGSRDGTRAVVEAWARRDERVRLIVQQNAGVAAARNRALAASRGEFIAPLDADDLWDPTKLERQVRRMYESGEATGLVYCWWTWVDVDGHVLDSSPRWDVEGQGADILLQVNYTGNASVPLYRRRCLEEIGGYDVTLRGRDAEGCEDWDVALKVAERSRVAVVPLRLAAYRRRQDTMSTRTAQMARSHQLLIESAWRRRPDLPAAVIRRSHDQFALHLAGVSFWSGAHLQAVGWGLRSVRSRLALRILPYVLRLFARRLLGRAQPCSRIIGPGTAFSGWEVPAPLIPYDRMYRL